MHSVSSRVRPYIMVPVLVNVNMARMQSYLQPTLDNVTSKAISSVPANVLNLIEVIPDLQCEDVTDCHHQTILRIVFPENRSLP